MYYGCVAPVRMAVSEVRHVVANETRVVIVEAQPLMRSGMGASLAAESDLIVLAEADSEVAALALTGPAPDVVVLGVGTGLLAVRAIRDRWPAAGILVVWSRLDAASIRRAFERGVTGVVTPMVDASEFVRAVRAVGSGSRYLAPEVGAEIVGDAGDGDRGGQLSQRERDVLRLLALGYTNQQIAHELVISIRTVEGHRAHLMDKVDASSRAELVQFAIRVGLLSDELARS